MKKENLLIYSMRAETRMQSVTLSDLSLEGWGGVGVESD